MAENCTVNGQTKGELSLVHPCQMPEPPQLASFDTKEWEVLLPGHPDVKASQASLESETQPTSVGTSFRPLVSVAPVL